jgi:uncharacterized protein YprB with RNaseH-like and TPR domain
MSGIALPDSPVALRERATGKGRNDLEERVEVCEYEDEHVHEHVYAHAHAHAHAHVHAHDDANLNSTAERSRAEPLLPAQLDRISQLRAQLARIATKPPRPSVVRVPVPVPDPFFSSSSSPWLPGTPLDTPDGPLRFARLDCEEDHCHGVIPVVSALEACSRDIAVLALDPTLANIDFSRALYIDTETTGLAGGSGTLPFLIGMAWFEGRRLCVEQLLLERPGLEVPMLRRLAERLALASAVVSFNGKSFDWPLLRTRFVLSRVAAPELPAHLDLLHCARRVYKRRLGSVRLVHLEEAVLGFTRIDDIAGEMIPLTYLGFLRGQVHGSALAPILEHNRSDLIALAALLGEITRRFRGEEPSQDARDQLSFAGVAARAADARALGFASGAVEADLRGELACEAHCLSGELCLKTLDFAAAERAFTLAVEAACGEHTKAAPAHLALAKLYEHRLKRYADALEHARQIGDYEDDEANRRRVARLLLKCARTSQALPLRL